MSFCFNDLLLASEIIESEHLHIPCGASSRPQSHDSGV
jgi:hypothetical protein